MRQIHRGGAWAGSSKNFCKTKLHPLELIAWVRERDITSFYSNETRVIMAKPPATQTKSPEEAALRYQKMREACVKRSISVVQAEKEVRSSILTPS
jgi:hypothetical protein